MVLPSLTCFTWSSLRGSVEMKRRSIRVIRGEEEIQMIQGSGVTLEHKYGRTTCETRQHYNL